MIGGHRLSIENASLRESLRVFQEGSGSDCSVEDCSAEVPAPAPAGTSLASTSQGSDSFSRLLAALLLIGGWQALLSTLCSILTMLVQLSSNCTSCPCGAAPASYSCLSDRHAHSRCCASSKHLQHGRPQPELGCIAVRFPTLQIFAGCIGFVYVSYNHIDRLPLGISTKFEAFLGHGGDLRAPLSKRVAYRLDTWFSTNAYSKTLTLLYITVALVYTGGLGLYAVSGHSLYNAFWQVCCIQLPAEHDVLALLPAWSRCLCQWMRPLSMLCHVSSICVRNKDANCITPL